MSAPNDHFVSHQVICLRALITTKIGTQIYADFKFALISPIRAIRVLFSEQATRPADTDNDEKRTQICAETTDLRRFYPRQSFFSASSASSFHIRRKAAQDKEKVCNPAHFIVRFCLVDRRSIQLADAKKVADRLVS